MLGQGLVQGLSAGIAYAMAFSFVNIVLGFFAGHFGFRRTHHVRRGAKLTGWLIILACAATAFIFNMGVGHFRDGLTSGDWEHARTIAMNAIRTHPFILASLESYALWGLGMLVSLLVALDVFALDDPYPGYGHITRHYKKCVQDLTDAKDDIREEMQGWRDEAVEKMKISRARASRWRTDYGVVLAGVAALQQAYAVHMTHLETCGNRLLEYYRGENTRSRTTPAPAHFAVPFKFENVEAPIVTMPKVLNEDTVDSQVKDATSELETAVTLLNEKYQEHMARFASITQVLAKVD